MAIQEVGCGSTGWNEVVQNRERWWPIVNEVMSLQFPIPGNGLASQSSVLHLVSKYVNM
jgi:hypothetical protein